ncbi:MAG: hypothetical protein V4507_01815 [Verrucomicrobiota bacterium]
MIVFRVLEILFIVVVMGVALTQVIFPLLTNRELFWFFKKESATKVVDDLEKEVTKQEELAEAKKLREKIEKMKKQG